LAGNRTRNDKKSEDAVLNIITRSLLIALVSTALSASGSAAGAGVPVAGKPMPPEEKQNADKFENEAVAGENSVRFAFGKSKIDDMGMMILRRNAIRLRQKPCEIVTLVAFTEHLGSRSYNLAVAEERISTVAAALLALGIPRKQIRRKNARLGKLSSACNVAACRPKVQQVELVYE
jgi:outer membrane protein OmpA-like peptidoglycan-associated protein